MAANRKRVKQDILELISVLNDFKRYVDQCDQDELEKLYCHLQDVWGKMPIGISDKHTIDSFMDKRLKFTAS